jgi:hypothetical protein
MNRDWSRLEAELIVADYFAMLRASLAGEPIDKTKHRQALKPLLSDRSDGSIEFKHQNISAVLINFDQPYLAGYKPRMNYQALLEQVVLEFLESDRALQDSWRNSPVLSPTNRPAIEDVPVDQLFVPAPEWVVSQGSSRVAGEPRAVRLDFVQRDAGNRVMGRLGEEWVLEVEQRRLQDVEGRRDLAHKVEWVADTRGDGLGYDIASFEGNGAPRLIEVKTTGLGREFPFYVTANEVRVSRTQSRNFWLYRVFGFSESPRLYTLNGALDDVCRLEPRSYLARPGRGG